MRARRIGRTLGIGVRVFARVATGRVAEPEQARAQSATQSQGARAQPYAAAPPPGSRNSYRAALEATAPAAVQAGQTLNQASQSVTRGLGGMLRPFRRVGGILWLEVTGVFFLLPVVVFAPALWREIAAYHHTSDHKTLCLTAAIMAVFLYLGVSSFWRAHKRAAQSQ
jgi:hypothetical protein